MTETATACDSNNDTVGTSGRADSRALLAEYLEALVIAQGRSENTAASYGKSIEGFFERMAVAEVDAITPAIAEKYKGRLYLSRLAPRTRRRHFYAVRSFFKWLRIQGHIPSDPFLEIPAPPAPLLEQIPVFSREELARLFNCPPAPEPRPGRKEPRRFFRHRIEVHHLVELRDRALLELLYDCALRGGEPSLLERRDYDEARGKLAIRGAKWHSEPILFPVRKQTAAAMSVYLDALRRSPFAGHPGLFPPIGARRADSKRPAAGIGPIAVYLILRKRVARAGIKAHGRRLSPHAIRYSRATHWSEDGVSIEHIRVLLRHRSIETARRYLALGPVARIKIRADGAQRFRRVSPPPPPG